MANPPLKGDEDLVSISVLIDGNRIKDSFLVTQIDVSKAINRIPVAMVTIADGDPSEETFEISESDDLVPGKKIEIKAGYHGKDATVFKGIIVKHSLKISRAGNSFLTLTCNDEAIKLTVARSNRQFVKKKDSDILAQLIKNAGLSADVEETTEVHEQVVEHDCTDWDFVVLRAEANGQVVVVDDGKVIVEPPKYQAAELVVTFGESIVDLDLDIDAVAQLPAVTCKTWNPAKQTVESGDSQELEVKVNKQGNIDGKTLADVLALKSFELRSFGPNTESALKSWANAQLLKSRLARFQGTMTLPGNAKPKPGQLIELKGLGARFNGSAFISSVSHQLRPGQWTTKVGLGLSRRWFAEEHVDIQAPAAAGLRPGTSGLQIATVKQIHEDPDGERRIKVVMPMVESGEDGIWVRLMSPYATSDAGIYFMPEIDDEVVLGFLNDDSASAVVLGSLHSSARKAPYVPDDKNTTKAIVSNSQMKISFDDVKKNLQIETPGGHIVTLSDENEKITITDSNKNKLEMTPEGVTLDSPGDISVTAKGSVTIDATGGINLKTPADVDIQGMNATVKADMAFSAEGQASAEVKASGQVTVQGAMVMIN